MGEGLANGTGRAGDDPVENMKGITKTDFPPLDAKGVSAFPDFLCFFFVRSKQESNSH